MRQSGIVLIGSGPSLRSVDPRRFAQMDTIAFNRSWLAWSDWGYAPRYHAVLDPATMAVIGPELPDVVAKYPQTHSYLHRTAARFGLTNGRGATLCELVEGDRFSGTVSPLTDYGNVGAISRQLLHALGYGKVLLVGVDGDYRPEEAVDTDHNHFRDDYARGRVPITASLRQRYTVGWPLAAAECKRLGLELRNASPGTALTCIDRTGLEEGLEWLQAPAVAPTH